MGSGNESPIGTAVNQLYPPPLSKSPREPVTNTHAPSLGGLPIPSFGEVSEDCLYMDIQVPARALAPDAAPLPVVVFIFGGGFILGSKDIYQPQVPFYDGSGMIAQSDENLIFISFNYRLGAFGFLAGSSMESDGLPNAGLWDQRAVFEWVRENIRQVNGDPDKVTAMGESAGASSIMHHLVAEGGTLDPLFHRAVLLSPASQAMWDRAGGLEYTFQQFASLAGCKDERTVECLRGVDSEVLMKANKDLMLQQVPGTFAVGPSPDGSFIRQLPALELASGNFWSLDSLVISHCADEAEVFVDGAITTNKQFDSFLSAIFPNYNASPLHTAITSRYPPVTDSPSSKYKMQPDRLKDVVRDSSMTCNVHYLNAAYSPSHVWNMQYSVTPGWHGTDLVAVFNNPRRAASVSWDDIFSEYLLLPLNLLFAGISTAVQSYLVSYVTTGDPNAHRAVLNVPPAIPWGHPEPRGDKIGKVLDVGNLLVREVEDDQVPAGACEFWRESYAAATAEGGYVPPGAEVKQGLVKVGGDVSARY